MILMLVNNEYECVIIPSSNMSVEIVYIIQKYGMGLNEQVHGFS